MLTITTTMTTSPHPHPHHASPARHPAAPASWAALQRRPCTSSASAPSAASHVQTPSQPASRWGGGRVKACGLVQKTKVAAPEGGMNGRASLDPSVFEISAHWPCPPPPAPAHLQPPSSSPPSAHSALSPLHIHRPTRPLATILRPRAATHQPTNPPAHQPTKLPRPPTHHPQTMCSLEAACPYVAARPS